MRENLRNILFFIIALPCYTFGQDVHFSQYYATPILNNPAFTGYFDGDIRVSGTFKSQWEGLGEGFGNVYRTTYGSGEVSLLKNKNDKSALGLGLTAFNDKAGDLALTTNEIGISMAYIQALDAFATNFISIGFKTSWSYRTLDLSNANFGDQFNPNTNSFDGGFSETDINTRSNWFNLSLGLLWYIAPIDKINFYVGVGVHNLMRANVSFFDESFTGEREELDIRYAAQFGAQFVASKRIDLIPSVLFQRQGPNQEMMIGSFFKVKFDLYSTSTKVTGLQIGGWYRFNDAIIPAVRYDHNELSVIFTYDVNLSSLTKASKSNGGPELSLVYTLNVFKKSNRASMRCPIL